MTLYPTAIAAAVAGVLMMGATTAQSAPARLPAKAAENSNLWFVEFHRGPTTDGERLAAVQADHSAFARAAKAAGVQYKLRRSFTSLFNGVSVEVSPQDRARLEQLPGVKAIYPVLVIQAPKAKPSDVGSQPELVASLGMIGADIAHNTLGLTGQGIKVGIIDSGVDIDHPDLGGSGSPGGTAFPTARIAYGWDFVGDAFNADPSSAAYNPVPTPDANPDDCGGHGTHVAGIVGASGGVTGVAPNVTLGAYRVFGCAGSTLADIMVSALERAQADGMQVVNQSIGAPFQWPQYPTAQATSRMSKAGIVMVASAGNSGALGLYATSAPAVGSGVISTASYDNAASALMEFTASPDNVAIGYQQASGSPTAPTSGTSPLSRTGDAAALTDACSALPAGSLTGTTALIRRGGCAFYTKAFNAEAAGATAVVLYNNIPGRFAATVAGTPAVTVPVVSISDTEGVMLDSRIAGGSTDMTWTPNAGLYANATGGLISTFSSMGLAPDLSLKPNLGAPGGMIVSTYPLEGGGYATLSGTSMAAPHTAGAAALLLQDNSKPGPGGIKAALQNTAKPAMWAGNAALGVLDAAHRQGAGMIDIPAAVQSTTRVSPSELALGEVTSSATRSLSIDNRSGAAATYTLAFESGIATGPDSYLVSYFNAPGTATFSATSVSVPARSKASVTVEVAPNPGLADASLFGGYIVVTKDQDGSTTRVPVAGFKGDYQAIPVLTPTTYGFPWLATLAAGQFTNQPAGATYTLVGDNLPYFLLHLNHPARRVNFHVIDATGKNIGWFSRSSYVGRNSTTTGFFTWGWNGNVYQDGAWVAAPNGTYTIRTKVLKALGDADNAADWETWVSPPVTLARP